MIKAIFFDWMKTLANIGELSPLHNILNKEELKELSTKSFEKATISREKKEAIVKILGSVKDIKLYSDSIKMISSLRKKYDLAIVSNMYPITNGIVRKNFDDFLNYFDIVALSTEVGLAKPNPKIFQYALNELNQKKNKSFTPSEVLVVGDDQEKDIEPAIKCGMQARLINRKTQDLRNILGDLI